MKKKTNDLIIGVVCLLVAIFYLVNAMSIKVFEGEGATFISSRTIPMLWGILMACLSLRLIWRGIKERAKSSKEQTKLQEKSKWKKENYTVAGTLLLLLLYVVGLYTAGFLVSTVFYLFLQILILTPKGKAHMVLTVLLSVIVTISIYILFVHALHVPLPAGWLAF